MLSQTRIFNASHSVIDSASVSSILTDNYNRETTAYISKLDLWLNKLFLNLIKMIKNMSDS